MKSSGARVHARRRTPSSRSRLVFGQVPLKPSQRRLLVRRSLRAELPPRPQEARVS
jgi:hypothetical protein